MRVRPTLIDQNVKRTLTERPEARRGIGHDPLRNQREHLTKHAMQEPAQSRCVDRLVSRIPRSDHDIRAAAQQRIEQAVDVLRRVLSVAVYANDDLVAV